MEPKMIFITTARGNGKSEMMFRELKKALKHTKKAAFVTSNAFNAFRFSVKEYMEEKNMEKKCKFKVGDTVINNSCTWYVHTGPGFVGKVVEVMNDGIHMKVKGKSVAAPNSGFDDVDWVVSISVFDLYDPHEGKILIMVDEKDNNKIIARDLLTNKTAEAKCNPKDKWNFNKGAKLALERLTEPEKPKGWNGKMVCISNNVKQQFSFFNDSFYPGRVYLVKNGILIDERGRPYTGIDLITEPKELKWEDMSQRDCPVACHFIEYKGEVTAE